MKEYDKVESHISNKLRMICIFSNNCRHPVIKTFTTLHPTTLHSTSLHLSTLHYLSFKLRPNTLHYLVVNIKCYFDKRKCVTACDMPKLLFHVL